MKKKSELKTMSEVLTYLLNTPANFIVYHKEAWPHIIGVIRGTPENERQRLLTQFNQDLNLASNDPSRRHFFNEIRDNFVAAGFLQPNPAGPEIKAAAEASLLNIESLSPLIVDTLLQKQNLSERELEYIVNIALIANESTKNQFTRSLTDAIHNNASNKNLLTVQKTLDEMGLLSPAVREAVAASPSPPPPARKAAAVSEPALTANQQELSNKIYQGYYTNCDVTAMIARFKKDLFLFKSVPPFNQDHKFIAAIEAIIHCAQPNTPPQTFFQSLAALTNGPVEIRNHLVNLQARRYYLPYGTTLPDRTDLNVQSRIRLSDAGMIDFYNASLQAKFKEANTTYDVAEIQRIRGGGNCYYNAVTQGYIQHAILADADERKRLFEHLANMIEGEVIAKNGTPYAKNGGSREEMMNLAAKLRRAATGEIWPHLQDFSHDMAMTDDLNSLTRASKYLMYNYLIENQHSLVNGLSLHDAIAPSYNNGMDDYLNNVLLPMDENAEGAPVYIGILPALLGSDTSLLLVSSDRKTQINHFPPPEKGLLPERFYQQYSIPRDIGPPRPQSMLFFRPGHYDIAISPELQQKMDADQIAANNQPKPFSFSTSAPHAHVNVVPAAPAPAASYSAVDPSLALQNIKDKIIGISLLFEEKSFISYLNAGATTVYTDPLIQEIKTACIDASPETQKNIQNEIKTFIQWVADQATDVTHTQAIDSLRTQLNDAVTPVIQKRASASPASVAVAPSPPLAAQHPSLEKIESAITTIKTTYQEDSLAFLKAYRDSRPEAHSLVARLITHATAVFKEPYPATLPEADKNVHKFYDWISEKALSPEDNRTLKNITTLITSAIHSASKSQEARMSVFNEYKAQIQASAPPPKPPPPPPQPQSNPLAKKS